MNVLLDTSIFNAIVDGSVDVTAIRAEITLFATIHQAEELNNTKEDDRRAKLAQTFRRVAPTLVATTSCIPDVSYPDTSCTSDGVLFGKLRADFLKGGGGAPRDYRDLLIAETALNCGMVLATHDKNLFNCMVKAGGSACNLYALLELKGDQPPFLTNVKFGDAEN